LTKNPLIYSVSYFNFGGFLAFWGAKPPWRRDWLPTNVYFENYYPNHANCDI